MRAEPLISDAARLHLVDGIRLLRPDSQVFTAMLEGWHNQQLSRNLTLANHRRPGARRPRARPPRRRVPVELERDAVR